jgi:hypothetical protein
MKYIIILNQRLSIYNNWDIPNIFLINILNFIQNVEFAKKYVIDR